MPYRIRKAPNRDLYWVVGEDGKHHSKDPIPLATAKKQMAALHIAMKGGEYPVPPPRGPMYFDTVEKTAYNQKQADEYKSMDSDPRRRELWNKAQKRLGRTATDKDYAAHRALANEVAKKRVAANPTYTPKELAEEKKRDYEQQKWQEDYKNWKKGADAYYAQHPGEQLVIPPLDEKSEKITLSREEWRKLPKITQAEAKRRLEVYKERNKSGWQKFSETLANAMAGLTDSAVGLVSDLVPGGKAIEVGYKTFAPPGSEYYKEGSVQDKFGNLPENIASAVGAGRGMRGGGYYKTKAEKYYSRTVFGLPTADARITLKGIKDETIRVLAANRDDRVEKQRIVNIFKDFCQRIRNGRIRWSDAFDDFVQVGTNAEGEEEEIPFPAGTYDADDVPETPEEEAARRAEEAAEAAEDEEEAQAMVASLPLEGTIVVPSGTTDASTLEAFTEGQIVLVTRHAGRGTNPKNDVYDTSNFRSLYLANRNLKTNEPIAGIAKMKVVLGPAGAGRRRGGMKHLTLDRPPKPGKKPITVAHPEDAAKIVRAPFAESVSASEIGKYFGKKGVKAATKMTESVYAPHPPDRPPPAPPAGPPPARKRPTIPAAAKPDHDWWVRDELAHDPSGRSLLALRALTTPGIASIVRSFTAPTADVADSHLGPLPMRSATKDEMVHQLWLGMIRSKVFDDNDSTYGMARAFYGHYFDMDWDEDHESSEDEGTEVNREAREAEREPRREAAREERWGEFLDRRQDDLEDIILTLGREGYHGEPQEPVDPDFWNFAWRDLAGAWNSGAFNRKIKELRFKYSLRPEQAAAVKAGIREKLEALRNKAAEAESSESSGDEAGDAGRAALAADIERAFATHTAAEMGALLTRPAAAAAAAAPAAAADPYLPNDMSALRAAVARLEAAEAAGDEREIAAARRAVDILVAPELFEGEGRGRPGGTGILPGISPKQPPHVSNVSKNSRSPRPPRPPHKDHFLIGGALPVNNILHKMAVAAYAPNPPSNIEGYVLIKATPGLKFYKEPTHPEIVVAIKGTDDWKDIKADVQIGYHSLANSARLKEDVETLNDFQEQYPRNEYTYYGVGHSLGGAILDEFLKMGLVKKGVSYNPAIQPGDIRRTDIDNHRIYKQGDFLYKLMGQFSMSPEVRSKSMTAYVGSFLNPLDPFTSHTLDNFEGGSKPTSKFQNQLKRAKVSPAAYLAAAKEKAKKKGLAWKHIGFSSDDTHKLQVPNAEGKLVRFGSVGQGDHVLYTLSHDKSADEHRKRYLARATKIKGEWKSDEYSPNSLAIAVLW